MKIWKKDGKKFEQPLLYGGKIIFNPTREQLISAGYVEEEIIPPTPVRKDYTDFNKACEKFRSVCAEIGLLIGKSDFKGGFDEMEGLEDKLATPEGLVLATKWNAADKLCTFEAKKLGIGQPQWWYRCWAGRLKKDVSNSVSDSQSYSKSNS